MASYDAAINVIISGQQKVDSLISSVSKLERVIGSVKTTPIDINLGPSGNITKQLQNTQNQIKRANNQINSLYSERIKTIEKIGKLNETIIRNEQILEKSAPSTQKYKNAERIRNNAIEKQIQLQEELNDLMEKSSKISSARSSIIDSQEELQGLRKKIKIVQILANSYLEYGDARKYSEETGLGRRGDLVKNETSIAQIKQQIAGFEQLTNNAKVASREFNRFAIATELASIKAGKAQQERLRALSEAFSKPQGYPGVLASSFKQSELAGARSAVSSLVSFYPNVAKSEAALSAYAAQLENLRSLVPIASSEFIQLSNGIKVVADELSRVGDVNRQLGPSQFIDVAPSGPVSDRLNSLKKQQEYATKVNNEYKKQTDLIEKIDNSALSQTKKEALSIQLNQALDALTENRLETAEQITKEIGKQLALQEKLAKPKRTQVFGVLGTDFLPITGKLAGGQPPVPGSPAAQKQIEDTVARWIKSGGPALPPAPKSPLKTSIEGSVKIPGSPKYDKAYLDLTAKIEAVEKRIFNTTAGQVAQGELLNQVYAARNALLVSNFDEAKRIVGQIDRNRFSLERQAKAEQQAAKGLQDEAEYRKRIANQFRVLETIQNNFVELEGKGVKFSRERVQLANILAKADREPERATARYVRGLEQLIEKFRTYRSLRTSEARNAGTFVQPVRQQTAEQIEKVRGNLLNQALGIQRQVIALDQKGASVAQEKIDIEEAILQLKNRQNKSTQVENELIAQQLIGLRNLAKEEANRVLGTKTAGAGKTKEPGFGLTAALEKLREARAARVSFLGEGVSPAEAIDKIVREFGTKKDIGAGVGTNVTNALASEITAGTSKAAAAGTALGDAVEDGLEKGLEIKSPSGVALRIARNVVNTLANALNQGKFAIQAASEALFSSLKGEGDQAKTELEQTFGQFRKQFSSLTTKPRYFNRLLSKIPDTGLTVEMAGAATDVFNKIKLPDILEGQIKEAYIKEFGKLPSFFADLVNEIKDLLNKVLPSGVGGGGRPPVPPGGGGGAGGAGDFNRRLAEAVQQGPQALLGLEELRQPARASINELNALSGVLTELRSVLDPTAKGFDKLDGQLREVLATVSRQLEVRAPEADFLTRRTGDPRLARGISEGVIGGAFPLLFGQGIGASIGGGLGGFAGGFAGGGLGFGLSLVGTALGTALDTFNNNLKELGKSLGEPTSALEAMKNAGLKVDKQLEFNVRTLEASGRAYQAQSVVLSEIEKQLGAGAVKQIQALNAEQKELETEWQRLSATLTSLLLPAITGTVAIINDAIDGFKLLSSIKLPGWLQSAINTGVNVASFVNPAVGLSRLQFQYAAGRGTEAAQQQTGKPQLSPEKAEESRKAALQVADEIKQAYREGFKLQQQAIDLERQAADFRKRIADDIFNKQQEVLRAQVETDRLSADVRIKAVDLEYQKRINQEEGRVAQLLEAEAELIRVKAAGQADIDSKRQLLELDIAKQERDTQNYIRNINTEVNNIRRQTLQYEMEVQDSREASERRIAELRRIDQMGAATGSMPTGPGGRQYYGPGGAPTGPTGFVQSRGSYTSSSVDGFPITSRPGLRWGRMHRGVDIGTPMGTALGYEVGGEVLSATTLGGYGKVLEVKLENGVTAFAAHLNEVLVKAGDRFTANQILARTGQTGRGTGPHLHMEGVRGGDPYSPLPYLQLDSMQAGSQVRQMQQAQSQIRSVNIPMVDTAAVGQQMTELNRQDEQLRRRSLDLSQQILNLDKQSALEKITSVARGAKDLDQRKYQLNLLGLQIKQTTGLKDEDRERGILAAEYLADVQRTADANATFIQQTRLDSTEKQAVLEAFEAGFKIRKEQYDLDVKILGIARMEAAARGGREAVAAFVEQNKQLDLEIQKRQLRLKLIAEGSSSQKIETEMRVFELQNKLTESLDKLNKETNDAIRAEAARLGINADMITSTFKLTEATLESLLATEQDTKKKEEYRKELERILALRKALEGDATSGTQDAIDKARGATTEIPGEKIGEAYKAAKDRLDELINKENQAIFVAQTIGDAFGQAFREIAAGTATAQEILSGFFQSLANSFADMAAQIIAEMIKMYILQQLLNVFGAAAGGAGGAAGAAASGSTGLGKTLEGIASYGYANGGVFANSIKPFAMGGVVNSPTLFKFANGGAMNTGVMGEAGPEAILPLSRGSDGKLGVSARGSGGDVNVTVNVDAKGTSVQGNDQSGNQLGRAISAAVQQEIIKQRRPGGLLNK